MHTRGGPEPTTWYASSVASQERKRGIWPESATDTSRDPDVRDSGFRGALVLLLLEGLGAEGAGDVIAESGDAGQQALVLEDAQRFGAGLAGVAVLLAERGDGGRGHTGREGSVGNLPAKPGGKTNIRSRVRFVAYRHPCTILDWQYCQSQRFDTSRLCTWDPMVRYARNLAGHCGRSPSQSLGATS